MNTSNIAKTAVALNEDINSLETYYNNRDYLMSCANTSDDGIINIEELSIYGRCHTDTPNLKDFLNEMNHKIDVRIKRELIERRALLSALEHKQDVKLSSDDVCKYILTTSGIVDILSANRLKELTKVAHVWQNSILFDDAYGTQCLKSYSLASNKLIDCLLNIFEEYFVDLNDSYLNDDKRFEIEKSNDGIEVTVTNCVEIVHRFIYQQTGDINIGML